jgi:signal transduction histidine kinase
VEVAPIVIVHDPQIHPVNPADRTTGGDGPGTPELILDRMVDAVILIDEDGIVQFANHAAGVLFETKPECLVRAPLGYPIIVDAFAEIEIVRRDRAVVIAEVRTTEIPWHGRVARLVSLRDVTERKRVEQRVMELDRQRLEADAANRGKADFLAVMSHELRTPLNAILGYADLLALEIDGGLNANQVSRVERIRASAQHLSTLVNDVLDLAKIDAGRLAVEPRPESLAATVDSAVGLLAPMAAAKSVVLAEDELDASLVYIGDERRVRQILVNLLQNAIKFTAAGGRVALRAGATAEPSPDASVVRGRPYVFVQVEDSGIGIPSDKLAAIFEPFVRVDSGDVRRTEGSGLGLAISRRLARAMDGDITIESRLGAGSIFNLWLPLFRDE